MLAHDSDVKTSVANLKNILVISKQKNNISTFMQRTSSKSFFLRWVTVMNALKREKLCRSCLSEVSEGSFQSVFTIDESSNATISFADMIMSISYLVQISLNDGLPTEICLSCSEKVLKLFQFKLEIEHNEQTLRLQHERFQDNLNNLLMIEDNYSNLDNVIKKEYLNQDENFISFPEVIVNIKEELNDDFLKTTTEENFSHEETQEQGFSEEQETNDSNNIDGDCDNREKNECKYCKKTFKFKSTLKYHSSIHTGIKKFECEKCNKKFRNRSSLNQHILTHSINTKPHGCEYCNASFRNRFHLNEHMLIHTGEKPFECEYCHKRFSKKFNLKQHVLRHTSTDSNKSPERNFECDQCNKKFLSRGHFQGHLLVHTGEKPFVCEHCSQAFARKSNLRRHLKLHINENK